MHDRRHPPYPADRPRGRVRRRARGPCSATTPRTRGAVPTSAAQKATLKWSDQISSLGDRQGWVIGLARARRRTVPSTSPRTTTRTTYDHLQFYALNPSNGNVVWQVDAGDVHGSSPAVASDGYHLRGQRSAVGAFNQRSKVCAYASTGGDPPVALHSRGTLVRLEPDARRRQHLHRLRRRQARQSEPARRPPQLWSYDQRHGCRGVLAGARRNGALYVGGSGRMVSLQTVSPGGERWSTPVTETGYHVESSPALSNDRPPSTSSTTAARSTRWPAPTARSSGQRSARPRTAVHAHVLPGRRRRRHDLRGRRRRQGLRPEGPGGDVKWSYPTGGPVHSSPAIGEDGTVYIGSDDYKVYALDGDDGRSSGRTGTNNAVSHRRRSAQTAPSTSAAEDGFLYAFAGGSAPQPARSRRRRPPERSSTRSL